MAEQLTIEQARQWRTDEEGHIEALNDRLAHLEQYTPSDLANASKERNQIKYRNRAITAQANKHLLAMEDTAKPTKQDRELMQELNKIVNLGDLMLAKDEALRARLQEKLGPVDMFDAPLSPPGNVNAKSEPEFSMEMPSIYAGHTQAPRSTAPTSPPVINTSMEALNISADDARQDEEDAIDFSETGSQSSAELVPPDPKGIYATLGVASDASMSDIAKAIKRKKAALHPDRQPNDPTANERFTSFVQICKFVDDESRRATYDHIKTVAELEDITKQVEELN